MRNAISAALVVLGVLVLILAFTGGEVPWSDELAPPTEVESAPATSPTELTTAPPREPASTTLEAPPPPVERVAQEAPAEAAAETTGSAPRGPLVGRLVDRLTGEPLPYYTLEVKPGNDAAQLVVETDAEGWFRTEELLEASRPRLELIDDYGLEFASATRFVRVEFDPLGAPLELQVDVGPTFFLDFELPPGLERLDLKARLLYGPSPDGKLYGRRDGPTAGVRAGRDGGLPWVRFRTWQDVTTPPAWLQLDALDDTTTGGAWVSTLRGIQLEPVPITFTSLGTLGLTLVERDGLPAAYVETRLVGLGERGTLDVREYTDEDGRLELGFLPSGLYRFELACERHAPFAREVSIVAGENELGSIPVEALEIAGKVTGVVRSRSGRYDGGCHISLDRTLGVHGATYDDSLDWEEDDAGDYLARFEFEDVYAGTYWLYIHCHDGFDFSAQAVRVTPPLEGIEFLLDDASYRAELVVLDAETGAELPDSELTWSYGEVREYRDGPRALTDPVPVHAGGESFEWAAFADGYRPAHGGASDLDAGTETPDGLVRTLAVRLERGFGTQVVARHRTGRGLLSGVIVRLDGVEVARTDERGVAWISADRRPDVLTLEKPGWKLMEDELALDEYPLWVSFSPER